jgi:hypothetical protein
MNPSIGYFILSLVVLGVLSLIYMVVGVGGIGGGSAVPLHLLGRPALG